MGRDKISTIPYLPRSLALFFCIFPYTTWRRPIVVLRVCIRYYACVQVELLQRFLAKVLHRSSLCSKNTAAVNTHGIQASIFMLCILTLRCITHFMVLLYVVYTQTKEKYCNSCIRLYLCRILSVWALSQVVRYIYDDCIALLNEKMDERS